MEEALAALELVCGKDNALFAALRDEETSGGTMAYVGTLQQG